MGLSETIIAAIIGALATMLTAIFQLVRNRAPEGSKPRKNRVRSLLATIALMIGCLVGGYAWSSLRAVSAKEELTAAMKAEFAEQFAALSARQAAPADAATGQTRPDALAATHDASGSAESVAHLPPCRLDAHPDDVGPVSCSERNAPALALCAAIPSAAQTTQLRVYARVPQSDAPWLERDAGAPTLGSLHIAESPVDYPLSADRRSVCLNVANWSVEETLAVRLVVEYTIAPKPAPLTAATPGAAST